MNEFNPSKAAEAQRKLCEEKGYPKFAPGSGVCYSCGRNIYTEIKSKHGDYSNGISVEAAAKSLVTGCPHCQRSYCD